MHGHYNPALVGLSVAIAIFASYTAFDLTGRMASTRGPVRAVWLACAALAMGGGIWAMHFVGMLALQLPVPVYYDVSLTLASLVLPVIVTGCGLAMIGRTGTARPGVPAAGIVMGGGIVGMHYLGMAGIRLPGSVAYDPVLVALSIAIAVAAATGALRLTAIRLSGGYSGLVPRLAGAVAMGLAVVGMHYTGMAAASFEIVPSPAWAATAVIPPTLLAMSVVLASFAVLTLGLASSLISKHLTLVETREAGRRALIEAQLEAERWVGDIAAHLPGAIFRRVLHADGRISFPYVSDGISKILGHDRRLLAVPVGLERMAEIVYPQDKEAWIAALRRSAETLTPMRFEGRILGPAGELRWVRTAANVRRDAQASVIWDGVVLDVTESRRQEEELTASLAEKEMLLREIHHRVKNNLQVVLSLLRIEARGLKIGPERERLAAIEQRIAVMSRIHEQLYTVNAYGRIDFGEHLRGLCSDLGQIFGPSDGISLTIAAEPLWCDLDTAIPLGLIANELITNAYKYAFPGGGPGTIEVRFGSMEGRLGLRVADDGVGDGGAAVVSAAGNAAGTVSSGQGIGRYLVAALARQVGGELAAGTGPGASMTLWLPAERFTGAPAHSGGAVPDRREHWAEPA